VTFECHFSTVVTLCAQLTCDLLAIAELFVVDRRDATAGLWDDAVDTDIDRQCSGTCLGRRRRRLPRSTLPFNAQVSIRLSCMLNYKHSYCC